MGTQKGIANLIRLKEGHYVLALKKNHKRVHKKVDTLFNKADTLEYQAMVYQNKETHHYDHSRIEQKNIRYYQPCTYLGTVHNGKI